MNSDIIALATKRLEDMVGAGVKVPWAAAGLADSELQARVEAKRPREGGGASDAAAAPPMLRELAPPPVAEAPPAPGESVEAIVAPQAPVAPPAAAPADGDAAVPVVESATPALEPTEAAVAEAAEQAVDADKDAREKDAREAASVVIDVAQLEAAGVLVPTQTRTALSEEFSHIKRQLLRNAGREDAKEQRLGYIMVTSALPGDGKTFCALNLAMSMAAEVDTSVLLVDADVVRPQVLERLGLSADKGLLEVLLDRRIDLRDVVLGTNVPKLSILPAGTPNRLSTELLASEAMRELLETLPERFPGHIVIFDAPPLLLTNEAKELATQVGQVVVVVKASTTPRRAVGQVMASLEQCPLVLTVLNETGEPEVSKSYGYGYGYGYHQ